MWCMWLSDSGSGFGKIVKRQTDLQKKCQKGLHNDKVVQMQVLLPLFMRFLLMISGSRKVTVKRENMETEHK